MLAMVTVLQYAGGLGGREAAGAVRTRLDWAYALGLPLDDEGFDFSVLSEFRARVARHGLEEAALDALLARLADEGLVRARGKQRTGSAHVIGAVRALRAAGLAGESVRAALEALAAACPDWLAARLCAGDWTRRYGARIDSRRLPDWQAERDKLLVEFARDGYALVAACYEDCAPARAREIPAVQVLRAVLIRNFRPGRDGQGPEVIGRREDGLESGIPPARIKVSCPYDRDARRGFKKEGLLWLGCKLHITGSCQDPPACGCPPGPAAAQPSRCGHDVLPGIITGAAATVRDSELTLVTCAALDAKGLPPGQALRRLRVRLRAQHGGGRPHAREHPGHPAAGRHLPAGPLSQRLRPVRVHHRLPRPHRRLPSGPGQPQLASRHHPRQGRHRRQVRRRHMQALPRPGPVHHRPRRPRADPAAPRASPSAGRRPRQPGQQALAAGLQAPGRHRGRHQPGRHRHRLPPCPLPRTRETHLEHVYSAVALNLHRLDAYWNDTPIDRTRTSHLARLDLTLRLAASQKN